MKGAKNMCTLRDVAEGKTVEILRLSRHAPSAQRLRELGLLPGSRITVRRKTCHNTILGCERGSLILEHPWDTKIHVLPWKEDRRP